MTYDSSYAKPITCEDIEKAMEGIERPHPIRSHDPTYISLHAFNKLQGKIDSGEEITYEEICKAHKVQTRKENK